MNTNEFETAETEAARLRMEDIHPNMSGEDKIRALAEILRVLRGEAERDGEQQ